MIRKCSERELIVSQSEILPSLEDRAINHRQEKCDQGINRRDGKDLNKRRQKNKVDKIIFINRTLS